MKNLKEKEDNLSFLEGNIRSCRSTKVGLLSKACCCYLMSLPCHTDAEGTMVPARCHQDGVRGSTVMLPDKTVMRDLGSLFTEAAVWFLRHRKHWKGAVGTAHLFLIYLNTEPEVVLSWRKGNSDCFLYDIWSYLRLFRKQPLDTVHLSVQSKCNFAWELGHECPHYWAANIPLQHAFGSLALSHDSQQCCANKTLQRLLLGGGVYVVAPVWWLRNLIVLTRSLLASWPTCMTALLGTFNCCCRCHFKHLMFSFHVQVKIQDCFRSSKHSFKWEKPLLLSFLPLINSHFIHSKCCSSQEELPSLIARHLRVTWNSMFKVTYVTPHFFCFPPLKLYSFVKMQF